LRPPPIRNKKIKPIQQIKNKQRQNLSFLNKLKTHPNKPINPVNQLRLYPSRNKTK